MSVELQEMFVSYNQYIKKIPNGSLYIAEKLREDNIKEALIAIKDFSEGVLWLSQASEILQQNEITAEFNIEKIKVFLLDVNEGLEKQDFVLVADMFEYEIMPFLKIFSRLKDMQSKMKWHVSIAKNGDKTLQLNNVSIYSNYRPYEDAERWVRTEINYNASHYLLIGLGLGYHLRALANQVTNKPITVYYFDKKEYELFAQNNTDWWKEKCFSIVSNLDGVENNDTLQVLVPNVWVKAIGERHPLYNLLDTIKVNQQSYKNFAPLMLQNAKRNIAEAVVASYPKRKAATACLIASGPSVQKTISWLTPIQQSVDIYVVGSALNLTLQHEIYPTAVIITDAQPDIVYQIRDTGYEGILYYLLTANAEAILEHKTDKFILCQRGYALSENFANQHNLPLLATGGSVATTAFSLIEHMGYENLVLFGQDLGFTSNQTHAMNSTSGKTLQIESNLFVEANNGSQIQTLPNLRVYLRWFNNHCSTTAMNVFNTAEKGAKINNVPLIDEQKFIEICK